MNLRFLQVQERVCRGGLSLSSNEVKDRRSPPVLAQAVLWAVFTIISASLAFDHSYQNYSEALAQFVQDGRIDYVGLCSDRDALERFLGEASVLSFEEYQTFSREQKMAFMINLYNAASLALVCNHPGMQSIEELKGWFRDAWRVKFLRLFDRTVGLSQLLNDILRPEFKDPRVHFALVTATKGDAELLNVPYRAEILNQQLDEQAEKFMLGRPSTNRFEKGVLFLSPKLRWYTVDFGDRRRLITFARRYFPQVTEQTRIQYTVYDWSLNSK